MHLTIVLSKKSQTKKALTVYSTYIKFYKVQSVVTKTTSVLLWEWGKKTIRKGQGRGIERAMGDIFRRINMFIILIVFIIVIVLQVYTFVKLIKI